MPVIGQKCDSVEGHSKYSFISLNLLNSVWSILNFTLELFECHIIRHTVLIVLLLLLHQITGRASIPVIFGC